MPPGGEKQQKSDSLQAIIQVGQLGFYPANSLALSALHHNQTDSILGLRDDDSTQKLRQLASELSVSEVSINLQGKVFNGFTDAFYRGKLPELVVVTAGVAEIPYFVEEFMDFLEKLCRLGFLLNADDDEIAVLDNYVPQMAIASYGVVFNAIMPKLATSISNMGDISQRQQERLLQKFSRAVFTSPTEGYDLMLTPFQVFDAPLALDLAGSKSMYTVLTRQILASHGIPCQFNPNGELGILEMELLLASRHLAHRLIPRLGSEKKLNAKKTHRQIMSLLENLGLQLGLLPGLVTQDVKSSQATALLMDFYCVSHEDVAMLHQLKSMMKAANLSDESGILENLLEQCQATVLKQ